MLPALTAIFLCQLAGEMLVASLALPLPGPVVGMAILFLALLVKGNVPKEIGRVGDGLLAHLSLLFVPAGAGIMMHVGRLEANGTAIGAALLCSTLLTILVTAKLMALLSPRAAPEGGGAPAHAPETERPDAG